YQTPPEVPVLAALAELLDGVLACEDAPFDMLTDLAAHGPEDGSRVADELPAFHAALHASHFVTMLRIGRELLPFDAASHTIGVHNIATLTAQCAKEAGLPVDVPLVSAAALCHDIGKFGCRGADAKRIPYLHYYYTWQWLSGHGMEHIAHISANHSTWDLEFENLPVESLLLIYADFRVRGTREGGRETVRIYSLAEAYAMILSKLADVTPEKERRYRTVYTKLRDFESYLHIRGVATEPGPAPQRETRDPALLTQQEALDALRALTFDHAIRLMHTVSTDASFDQLLEQARGEKNTLRIRTYLELFQEYHTYMSGGNKRKLLAFLYELLLYPEGDVRRLAGQLMGSVLANSGPKYRKELPSAAPQDAAAPAMLSVLEESLGLWEQTVAQCLHPDHKISPKHAQRISNS
ncbi:MAG: HD domain-containing protein, partial [Oscillospiraceae bacterium]